MQNSSTRSARRWHVAIVLLGIAEIFVLVAMVNVSTLTRLDGDAVDFTDASLRSRRLLQDDGECSCPCDSNTTDPILGAYERNSDEPMGGGIPGEDGMQRSASAEPMGGGIPGEDGMQRTLGTYARSTTAASAFCQDQNPTRSIQATNVKFNERCSSYLPIKKPAMTSPCALWQETMTGSNVQSTFSLTIAFSTPPRSMKIVVDDGPSDTSITNTNGMWSVEAIFDTDMPGSDWGGSLFDMEDETTHSDVFSAFFRDSNLDSNVPIEVFCH